MFAGERLMLNVFNQRRLRQAQAPVVELVETIPPTTKARGFLGVGS